MRDAILMVMTVVAVIAAARPVGQVLGQAMNEVSCALAGAEVCDLDRGTK